MSEKSNEAVLVSILLSDWKRYGLAERVRYHFHLTDALGDSEYERRKNSDDSSIILQHQKRILECVGYRNNRKHRRILNYRIEQFNRTNTATLPLNVTTVTRVYFAYEYTRIAITIDASTSLLSSESPRIDRIPALVEDFVKALIEKIDNWEPYIFVTVSAVLPDRTCLLLTREYPLNHETIPELSQKLRQWLWTTVENEIASRYAQIRHMPSNFATLWEASQSMLATMSDEARPLVLLVTDVNRMQCSTRLEEPDHPLIVLDVSSQAFVTDDREALCRLASLYLDEQHLHELSKSSISSLHTLRLNLIQRYTLLFCSPLTPGTAPPPRPPSLTVSASHSSTTKSVLSTYILNPVRIVGLLIRRVKEGFRVKQYGQSTMEIDKVFVQLVLPLEGALVLHYELSYQALPNHSHMIGFGHIRLELSGDPAFVQIVKRDFLHPAKGFASPVSTRICSFLKLIRQEDTLRTYLSPVRWTDQLSNPDTPFLRRLAMLSPLQRRLHFRQDFFDCVCVGRMPYDDPGFLQAFQDIDNGENELKLAISNWATATIVPGRFYVKVFQPGAETLPAYAIVELQQNRMTSRLFSVSVEAFEGIAPTNRWSMINSLRESLKQLKDVHVLDKQYAPYLVGLTISPGLQSSNLSFLESQHDHERWELVYDAELLPLLMKRRTEIGKFFLLDSSEKHSFFAKIAYDSPDDNRGAGDLVQYKMQVVHEKVVVDLHMESESATFVNNVDSETREKKFHRLVRRLKKRDQDCARALQSRRHLLNPLAERNEAMVDPNESQQSCVERLLQYSSKIVVGLRFFTRTNHTANRILYNLTEATFLSQSLGARTTALTEVDSGTLGIGPGSWFLAEHNRETLSFIHLSLEDHAGPNHQVFRHVTLFTVGIGDLYSTREEDIPEDESEDEHITERLCVSEFVDLLNQFHRRNFSRAAYEALVHEQYGAFSISQGDLNHCFDLLEFVEASSVDIKCHVDVESGPDLGEVILSVMRPIDSTNRTFIYKGSESITKAFCPPVDDESSGAFTSSASGADDESMQYSSGNTRISPEPLDQAGQDTGDSGSPIFLKLKVNGQELSIDELARIPDEVRVSIFVSVLKSDGRVTGFSNSLPEFPTPVINAVLEVNASLKAFVAEVILEKLGRLGLSISTEDMVLARKVLRRARNVLRSVFEIHFYCPKEDAIYPANNVPVGSEVVIEEGFNLMLAEMKKDKEFAFLTLEEMKSYVVSLTGDRDVLSFWCFLSFSKTTGDVSVELFHPRGSTAASKVVERLQLVMESVCHRVNQLILLKAMHQSRLASRLLVPSDGNNGGKQELRADNAVSGMFSCPVVFEKQFGLYYRCAANPSQIVRSLEASVLHIFALSNRRHVFVYTDETGSIFYMQLMESNDSISLSVFGVREPDTSLTVQLTRLLQKRLDSIAVEMLSGVLTKNPRYLWRIEDVQFVLNFSSQHNTVEAAEASPSTGFLLLPTSVTDPGMFFMYFRQNLLGSTYFHPLSGGSDIIQEVVRSDSRGMNFVFFYSNISGKVMPEFRSQSTLTDKGKSFARHSGTGVAVISVSLCSVTDKSAILPTCDRRSQVESFFLSSPNAMTVLKKASRPCTDVEGRKYFVEVTIFHTSLKVSYISEWIELTMNQALATWFIETLFETKYSGIAGNLRESNDILSSSIKEHHVSGIDSIQPSLCRFLGMLEYASGLPHPGALKSEHQGVIRSSSVASVALDILERVVLDQICLEGRGKLKSVLKENITIIRLCRNESPLHVTFKRCDGNTVVAIPCSSGGIASSGIVDSPIECPEYLVLCHVPSEKWLKEGLTEASSITLFSDVVIDDLSGQAPFLIEHLENLRVSSPSIFTPSFGFILSIKRNRRVLLAYNWSRSLFEATTKRWNERDRTYISSVSRTTQSLQLRSLSFLAPPPERKIRSKHIPDHSTPIVESPNHASIKPKKFSIIRPMIRKPKLIGKSVDGAAVQAMAASRARASSSRFKNPLLQQSSGPVSIGRGQSKDALQLQKVNEKPLIRPDEMTTTFIINLKNSQRNLRSHTAHMKTVRRCASAYWPTSKRKVGTIEYERALFALSRLPLVTENTVAIPFKTRLDLSLVKELLGHVLTRCVVGSQVLAVNTEGGSLQKDYEVLLLLSPFKLLKKLKFYVAYQIVLEFKDVSGGPRLLYTRGRTYIVTMPRKKTIPHACTKRGFFDSEREARGASFLADQMSHTMPLESALFDALCLMVQRCIKSGSGEDIPVHISAMPVELAKRFPVSLQVKGLVSGYKLFRTSVVLKSFHDPAIEAFDGHILFSWLSNKSSNRDLLQCSDRRAILFAREIVVRGTRSVFFLLEGSEKFDIFVMTRTHGANLFDWFLREDSIVAASVANAIAIEAAGMVLSELQKAANVLHLAGLWTRVSRGNLSTDQASILSSVTELMDLSICRSVRNSRDIMDGAFGVTSGFAVSDWRSCCVAMGKDRYFTPSYRLRNDDIYQHIFYIAKEDVFLLVTVKTIEGTVDIALVEREVADRDDAHQHKDIIRCIEHFLLHFAWSEMLC